MSTHSFTLSTDFHTIICCTASRRVFGAEMTEDGYIQGAGDDSEGWSKGLTPTLFWGHSEQLLAAVEEDMPDLIQGMINMDQGHSAASGGAAKIGSTRLYIGTLSSAAQAQQYDGVIICGGTAPSTPDQENKYNGAKKVLNLSCGDGKIGSRALRSQLHHIPSFVANLPDSSSAPKIIFSCPTGKDLSVGVALTVLCLFFDDNCVLLFSSSSMHSPYRSSADRCPCRPFQSPCHRYANRQSSRSQTARYYHNSKA